jgi:hypothetical protein
MKLYVPPSWREFTVRSGGLVMAIGNAVVTGQGDVRMLARPLISQILSDESLTRGLGDAEARVLVEWLVERAEELCLKEPEVGADFEMRRLCRRGRAIARFVNLWCLQRLRGAAIQLAATERFHWQLPDDHRIDACELMQDILFWEKCEIEHRQQAAAAFLND